MKKIFLFSLFLVTSVFYAQSNGITYQAIIYNPNTEFLPGVNNANAPMVNKRVCLQFSIVDAASQTEYQETITTTTDEFGMVNTIIGSGVQTGGYATSFSTIYWSVTQKSLKVALDVVGQCANFVQISNQNFESVPFAFAANSAENVTGVVPIENGGTNAITVQGAKTNLGLQNVDNTRDLDKPVSTATQAALNLKEDLTNKSVDVTVDGTSNVKYPSVKAVKTYVDSSANTLSIALSNEASIRANADTVLTNDLAAEVINRTNADLLKEDLANKSNNVTTDGSSTTKYPTVKSVKDYVDANATSLTAALNNEATIRADADTTLTNNLANEVTNRTNADTILTNNLAAEVTNRTNADLLKENLANKSINVTTDGNSDAKYPSVRSVKDYVDASVNTQNNALSNEAIIRANADTTLTNNLANEVATRTSADLVLTNNLATEISNRTNADLLKENLVNKSNNVTTDGLSTTKYPTVKAVKDYVDANAASQTIALSNEATIRANADATLTNNLANEVASRTNADATLTNNLAAEITNRTNADLTKEDLANKSTSVITDGGSDTKFPSVKSVKTYVDASAASQNTALLNEANTRANADTALTNNLTAEVTNRTNADAVLTNSLSTEIANRTNADLLKEDLANKSGNVISDGNSTTKYPTVKSVKDYVDANATSLNTALTNEISIRANADVTLTTNLATEVINRTNADTTLTSNLATETTNRTNADATLTSNLATEVTNRTNADSTLTNDLATEVTNRTNADLLKENLANKSTSVTTDGNSDTKYPSVKSVKEYVDANATSQNTALTNEATIRANADNTLTSNLAAEVTNRTNDDTTLTNNLATEIINRTNADLLKEDSVNKSNNVLADGNSITKYPTVKSVKDYVDVSTASSTTAVTNEAAIRAAADTNLTSNLAAEVSNRTNADNTLTNNLATEISNRINADLLKEDLVNKSTDVTIDGTSDTKYPSVKSVKTYVDANASSQSTALSNEATIRASADTTLTNNLAAEVTNRTNAVITVTNNLASEVSNRISADLLKEDLANKSNNVTTDGTSITKYPTVKSVKDYVDAGTTSGTAALTNEATIRANADTNLTNGLATEVTNRTNADTTLTNNLATEVSNRTNANLLKEDLANKSNNVSTDGTSITKYPTVKSVKDYVDASITSVATALTNEATIRANADTTLTNNLAAEVSNRTNADATLTNNLAREIADRTNADALKEDLANKSTSVLIDGTSDTKYPSVKSVKTYVDANSSAQTTGLANEATVRANADITLANNLASEITNRANADLLKEDVSNKSNNVTTDGSSVTKYPTVKSIKDYVDTNATSQSAAVSNEASVRAAADVTLTNALAAEVSNRTNADSTLTNNLATEITNRTNADVLKEDLANKSIDVTTDATSDTKYPSVKSVKSYVDASSGAQTTALNNEATIRGNADTTLTNGLSTEVSNRTNADTTLRSDLANEISTRTSEDLLKEDVINKSNSIVTDGASTSKYPSVKSVKDYMDLSMTNYNAALAAEASRATSAEATKEDTANKSTDVTLADATNVKFPTELAVKTYVDNKVTTGTAANVSGVVAVANGGTGAATATAALTNLGAAPIASPTFTGTVSGIDKTMVGLANVDNTTDLLKPISTATQTALDDKLTKPIYKVALGYLAGTGQPDRSIAIGSNAAQNSQAAEATAIGFAAGQFNQGLNAVALGSAAGNNNQAANSIVINAGGSANPLNASTEGFFVAPVRNITSSDFVYYNSTTKEISYGGITAAMVGLNNVDNTTDLLKPISTATQTALDLKANIASPTFTGTPTLPTGTIGVTQTAGDSTTALATTAFVTSAVTTATPDATVNAKGKIQLTGDLTGSAISPAVAAGAINTAKLANDAVTSAKILDGEIVVADIADNAVETAKIKNANVTNAKLDKANIPLSGFAAAAVNVDLGSNKLTNVTNPTSPQDAATKNYVDTYSTINAISTVTADYTAVITDYTILSNSTAGGFTITLPNAATSTGKVYVIRKTDETHNLLTFSPALKLTETTMISSINFPKTIRIQSNGTSWYVID